ncbi:hypothetical protein EV08_1057 [Prochlorococcus marinus str. SS2]|nr:hypothetical protein EV08_1057 [Prochlorococcus marinus str. SS2]
MQRRSEGSFNVSILETALFKAKRKISFSSESAFISQERYLLTNA